MINDLLCKIKEVYPSFASQFFAIQYIDGISKKNFPYLEVEKEINNSICGKILSFDETLLFFDNIVDIFELLIIANPKKENFKRSKLSNEIYENNHIVIEYFDSGYIELNINSQSLSNEVKKILW